MFQSNFSQQLYTPSTDSLTQSFSSIPGSFESMIFRNYQSTDLPIEVKLNKTAVKQTVSRQGQAQAQPQHITTIPKLDETPTPSNLPPPLATILPPPSLLPPPTIIPSSQTTKSKAPYKPKAVFSLAYIIIQEGTVFQLNPSTDKIVFHARTKSLKVSFNSATACPEIDRHVSQFIPHLPFTPKTVDHYVHICKSPKDSSKAFSYEFTSMDTPTYHVSDIPFDKRHGMHHIMVSFSPRRLLDKHNVDNDALDQLYESLKLPPPQRQIQPFWAILRCTMDHFSVLQGKFECML
ncbi:hypothetical protein BLNAU_6221 [Blattamonas nauphoetae]|uniref:Uncharacterized protein n=1 Tax=Blattamonas nauphoetae TaxID=2049346 RepID=A0ABQ9Y4U1_9EUKA|nr:hypothetical protein BLNAU_6221 [Blattamonas nauphoetae]